MSDLLRDAPIGQLIRWVTKNRVLQYPEEKPDFVCPNGYQGEKPSYASATSTPIASPPVVVPDIAEKLEDPVTPGANLLTTAPTVRDVDPFDHAGDHEYLNSRTLSKVVTRPEMSKMNTRADLEQAYTNATQQESMKYQQSRPIMPEKTTDGIILVDWYETNDQENPQNWSGKKKGLVVLQIYLYTLAVYMG
jgi:DHA1 family multidrug resistance protein-like MFS transporter